MRGLGTGERSTLVATFTTMLSLLVVVCALGHVKLLAIQHGSPLVIIPSLTILKLCIVVLPTHVLYTWIVGILWIRSQSKMQEFCQCNTHAVVSIGVAFFTICALQLLLVLQLMDVYFPDLTTAQQANLVFFGQR